MNYNIGYQMAQGTGKEIGNIPSLVGASILAYSGGKKAQQTCHKSPTIT